MQKMQLTEQEVWDKKKIAVVIAVLVVLAGALYGAKLLGLETLLLSRLHKNSAVVKGIATANQASQEGSSPAQSQNFSSPSFTLPKVDLQQKLNAIKEQVASLKVEDIASSSPQLQKVVNDIKSLEQYPRDQAKMMCENICKSL